MEEKNRKLWNDFYEDEIYDMRFPGESEIKFFGRAAKKESLIGKKALDFGCGIGRDLIFMNTLGLEVYGLDTSKVAIEKAHNRLFNLGHDTRVQTFDGKKIPFDDDFFDFIISFGVLDHMLFKEAKELMTELKRVLKPNGQALVVVHSYFDSSYGRGEKVDDNTFIINFGEVEVGLPQHYFIEKEIEELISDFKLERISLHEDRNLEVQLKFMIKKDSLWELYLRKGE
jgi:SAM-dependent methyltransferase